VSRVEQRPLSGARIAVFSYFIQGSDSVMEKVGSALCCLFPMDHYQLLFVSSEGVGGDASPRLQTKSVFNDLLGALGRSGMSILNNTVRTWIFVRDVDNNYAGMVQERKSLFEKQGLTPETRYIASTGIEGRMRNTSSLISMDSLSVAGAAEDQMVQLEALTHMNKTHEYGVTFERGTKLIFGDRTHFYISGTASINAKGDVEFVGDAAKQARRALENIEALLKPHSASLADMMYLIVYLRDPSDDQNVRDIVREMWSDSRPLVVVHAPVCRPEWLVEIEGVGITVAEANGFNIFS